MLHSVEWGTDLKKKVSLRWKFAAYMLVFAFGLIGLLAVFQLVLLQPMYEHNKMSSVRSAAAEVANAIINGSSYDEIVETIYSVSAQNDTCVRVIYGSTNYATGNMGCLLYTMSDYEVLAQKRAAEENDNEVISVYSSQWGLPGGPKQVDNDFKSIIDTRIVDVDGVTAIIMVYAGLSPVNATVQTLQTQILYISIIILIAMVILITIMNHSIARPLTQINDAAKQLPQGNYEVDPKSNKYKEAVELNQTLTQAASDIQKADKAKRDLIANVSHDLRTPLTMISGYGEMMRDLPGEKTDENIQVIIDESHRLTYLVNDLLDLSKMEEGKIILEVSEFSLSSLIRRNIKKYEVYSVNEQFEFQLDIDDNFIVRGDEKRIEQVFNNFITNAINYSNGSKKVIVRAFRKDNRIRVEVQDFGEGIAEDKIKDIWDRYYKIDKEHVRALNSSGIGLSIVRQILDLHKAPYGVESKLNEGSTFWFELPEVKE